MMSEPRVSIIMSVYNGERYLKEAIESILNQTCTDFEFIIVNDGSTDGSLELIQNFDDERIRLINNEKNIGLTKSLNKALKQARGEYIARQDADDISLPSRLEEQLGYLEKHPEVALLGTGAYFIDESGNIVGREVTLANPSREDLARDNQFAHGSVVFRRKIIDELGGYNELYRYSQDYELWLRIAMHHKAANLPHPLYEGRRHGESIQAMRRREGALYHLLALKLSNGSLDEKVVEIVRDKGISSLYPYLNSNEKLYLHKSVARTHIANGDLKAARQEYKRVFALAPCDIRNAINFVLLYLRKGIMDKMLK